MMIDGLRLAWDEKSPQTFTDVLCCGIACLFTRNKLHIVFATCAVCSSINLFRNSSLYTWCEARPAIAGGRPGAQLKLDLTKTIINNARQLSRILSWASIISEKSHWNGLVKGPLLVGGLGPGPLRPLGPLNPDQVRWLIARTIYIITTIQFNRQHISCTVDKQFYVLAERCNCIAKFSYCHVLSVICLSATRVYYDKTTETIGSCSFH